MAETKRNPPEEKSLPMAETKGWFMSRKIYKSVSFVFLLLSIALTGNAFITDWTVLGPFYSEEEPVFAVQNNFAEKDPELKFTEGSTIEGERCVKFNSKDNIIDLFKVFFRKDSEKNTVFYAFTSIYFDEPATLNLFASSEGPLIIYLNGEPVHFCNKTKDFFLTDIDMVENAGFQKGWNQVVVKTSNNRGACAFFLCLADKTGIILPGSRYKISLDETPPVKLNYKNVTDSLSGGIGKGSYYQDWVSLIYGFLLNPEKVKIELRKSSIINNSLTGLGVQGDLFFELGGYNKASKEKKEMIYSRVKKLNPALARLFLVNSWWNPRKNVYNWDTPGMKNLYAELDLYQSGGAEVILSLWRCFDDWIDVSGNSKETNLPLNAFAESIAKLIKQLIVEKKYSNIKYLSIYNEPDFEFKRGVDAYKIVCTAVKSSLEAEGVGDKIKLLGSDEAANFQWFAETAKTMDGIFGAYASHHYQVYEGLTSAGWINQRTGFLKELGIKKDWLITEFGSNADKNVYNNGICVAEYVLAGLNGGASGMSYWNMQATMYPVDNAFVDYGLWGGPAADFQVRPAYYAYCMLTRNIKPGMQVIESISDSEKTLTLACKNSEDKVTLLVINRSNDTTIEVSPEFAEGVKFLKYTYDTGVLGLKDDNPVQAAEIGLNADKKLVDSVGKYSFAVYVEK